MGGGQDRARGDWDRKATSFTGTAVASRCPKCNACVLLPVAGEWFVYHFLLPSRRRSPKPSPEGGRPRRTQGGGSNIHSNVHGRKTVQQVVLLDALGSLGSTDQRINAQRISAVSGSVRTDQRSDQQLAITPLSASINSAWFVL